MAGITGTDISNTDISAQDAAGTDISDTGISAKDAVEKDYADNADGDSGETAEKKKMTQETDQSHAHAAATTTTTTTTTSQIKTPAPPPATQLDRRGPVAGASGGASSPLATGQVSSCLLKEHVCHAALE